MKVGFLDYLNETARDEGGGSQSWGDTVYMPGIINPPARPSPLSNRAPGYGFPVTRPSRPGRIPVTSDNAAAHLVAMTPTERARLARGAAAMTGGSTKPSTQQWLWNQAVGYAAAINAQNPKARMSPWDAMDALIAGGGGDGGGGGGGRGGGGGGGGGGPTTQTSVTSQVQQTTTQQARQMLNQAMNTLVGRDVTDAQLQAFVKRLNTDLKKNPTKQVSVTTQQVSGSTASSVSQQTQTGGFDQQQAALDFAKQQPDYAEFQTAVPYMEAFMRALGSPAGG